MPVSFFPRWCLILFSMLAASCTESREFRVEGPETTVNHTHFRDDTEFAFQVCNLDPANGQHWEELWHQANIAINGFVSSGNYTIRFTDEKTGEQILVANYSLLPDLLFQHDIHLTSYSYGSRYGSSPARPLPPTN